jgi:hypothetical protein
MISSLQMIFI